MAKFIERAVDLCIPEKLPIVADNSRGSDDMTASTPLLLANILFHLQERVVGGGETRSTSISLFIFRLSFCLLSCSSMTLLVSSGISFNMALVMAYRRGES